jgi:hypothetical protein
MHYSLTFYAPDISRTVATLIENEIPYLARKGESPLDGHTYFTIIIQSPSGKVFEITSTVLDDSVLAQKDILTWKHANECPECHFSSRYKRDELNAWYVERRLVAPLRSVARPPPARRFARRYIARPCKHAPPPPRVIVAAPVPSPAATP